MKKFLAIFLSLIMVLSLAACSGNGGSDDDKDDEKSKASDEEDKDDEKDTDADGAEDETADKVKETTAQATEAEPVETEATTAAAPAEEATTAAAPVSSAGTLEFHGVTIDIPAGFKLTEDTDTSKMYASADGNTILGLLQLANVTYEAAMAAYSSAEGLITALVQDNSTITNVAENTVYGKKVILATADVTEDDGSVGNTFYIVIFFDNYADVLIGIKSEASSDDDIDAVENALDGIRF